MGVHETGSSQGGCTPYLVRRVARSIPGAGRASSLFCPAGDALSFGQIMVAFLHCGHALIGPRRGLPEQPGSDPEDCCNQSRSVRGTHLALWRLDGMKNTDGGGRGRNRAKKVVVFGMYGVILSVCRRASQRRFAEQQEFRRGLGAAKGAFCSCCCRHAGNSGVPAHCSWNFDFQIRQLASLF
ncbi:hypothetical protein NY78_4391 [Desulfovibrio sp. TomC]|nr:hypothetical protein NY78_4391 [Desulfovibrio sp. TomC]